MRNRDRFHVITWYFNVIGLFGELRYVNVCVSF